MLKLILMAFISLSIRTANTPDTIYDYEIKGGGDTRYIKGNVFFEREIGILYKGLFIQTKKYEAKEYLLDGWGAEIYIREAQGINQQRIDRVLIKNGQIEAGATIKINHWGDPLLMANINFKGDYYQINFLTNLQENLVKVYIGKEMPLKYGFYVHPFMKYNNYGVRDFAQFKVEVGYKWQ